MKVYRLSVTPMGKPRMTKRDRWAKRPVVTRYFEFADTLRVAFSLHGLSGITPTYRVRFGIPMPKSWSKKKRAQMDGKPHQQKPDIDNLLKAFMDPLGGDEHVWRIQAEKVWTSGEGFIAYQPHPDEVYQNGNGGGILGASGN
jgi:Holliday junction resolvase RusA-like endonuclease